MSHLEKRYRNLERMRWVIVSTVILIEVEGEWGEGGGNDNLAIIKRKLNPSDEFENKPY